MTFVTHLKRLDGGGYASKRESTRKTFPVFTLPVIPTEAMVDAVRNYLEIRAGEDVAIDIGEMLAAALCAERGGLL